MIGSFPSRRGPAWGVAVLGTVLLGGVGMLLVPGSSAGSERVAPAPPRGASDPGPPAPVLARGGDHRGIAASSDSPRRAHGRSPVVSPARVRAAVTGLAASLVEEPVDRAGWERRVRAVAGSLGSEARAGLLELAEEDDRPAAHHVAAAELLRVLNEEAPGTAPRLPGPALRALRAAVLAGTNPVSAAAGRALSALGEAQDRASLLQVLATDDDPARRSWASWSLQAAVDDEVGFELLDLVQRREGEELALSTLGAWARARKRGPLAPGFLATATIEIESLLGDPDTAPSLRRRALSALASLDARGAAMEVRDLLAHDGSEDEFRQRSLTTLAGLGTSEAVGELEALLLDPCATAEDPLALAEAWTRVAASHGPRPEAAAAAQDALVREARAAESPERRRRALLALGRTGTAEAAASLIDALVTDPAPAVRAAAVRALQAARGEDAGRAALEAAGTHDPSPEVRRLAQHVLAGWGRP